MLSALKRLTGKADGGGTGVTGTPSPRPGLQAMSHSLQRKFARGVQYNMKIIIKGDRNVGKTCLFHRLQGGKFVEEYIPTEEIQVASIQWSYKATEDVVKVEVWDVVDHGRKRRQLKGLKLGPECNVPGEDGGKGGDGGAEDGPEEATLDAQFLDVYKGTNGVVLMMDVTKSWTFDYVVRELPKIPHHIPVLVLANHCDMGHHRTVTADTVTYFIEGLNRSPGSIVRYAESSMRNGFGLRLLHRFLNVPFLRLQRDTLEAQLATNARETDLTIAELDLYQSSDEADYDKFLENLTSRRRAAAENTGLRGQAFFAYDPSSVAVGANGGVGRIATAGNPLAPPTPSLHPSQSSSALSSTSTPANDASASISVNQAWNQGQMPRPEPLGAMKKSSSFPAAQTSSLLGLTNPANPNPAPSPVQKSVDSRPATGPGKPEPKPSETRAGDGRDGSNPVELSKEVTNGNQSHFMSKLFGRSSRDTSGLGRKVVDGIVEKHPTDAISSLDEFMPEGGMAIDRSFLEDDSKQPLQVPIGVQHDSEDEDSDTGKGNPLVAGFQDDLDSDYEYSAANQSSGILASMSGDVNSSPALTDDDAGGERPLSVASGREGEAMKAPCESHLVEGSTMLRHQYEQMFKFSMQRKIECERWSMKKSFQDNGDLEVGLFKENNVSSDESLTIPSLGIKTAVSKEKVKKKKEKGDEKSSKKHKKTKKKKEKDGESKSDRRKKKGHTEDDVGGSGRLTSDELEEFLNGSPASVVPEAYEAI